MWTGDFDRVSNHYSTDFSTGTSSFEHDDFCGESSYSIFDTPSMFSPAPQPCSPSTTYGNVSLPMGIKLEEQCDDLFETFQDLSTAPETHCFNSLGLFSGNSSGRSLFDAHAMSVSGSEGGSDEGPPAAEMLDHIWPNSELHHGDFEPSQYGANDTPSPYDFDFSNNDSFEGSVGSVADWNLPTGSLPPTPHDVILGNTHWDPSWLSNAPEGNIANSSYSSTSLQLARNFEACDRRTFAPLFETTEHPGY